MAADEVKVLEEEILKKTKLVAMLAPCYVVDFDYPEVIGQLKELGFDKVVELTFGAKMVNLEYHKLLKKADKLVISATCAGIVDTIRREFPQYADNIARIYSPMVATAMICKKIYPEHKTVFVSPCNFKKLEAKSAPGGCVDMVVDAAELHALFDSHGITPKEVHRKHAFDKFYNDYTKIYPTAGGLSKTAHLKGVLKPEETLVVDGIAKLREFMKKPGQKIKFLDATFCVGACIGGPLLRKDITLAQKRKRVLAYVTRSLHEPIADAKRGIVKDAKGLKFSY
ncbi:MAG: hypothetical protein NT016_01440 [Candidatus Aenigmarchaeota archaeon]|nr:hypothetical protein [Candidatus Aenigmarchaeota archaeon]